MTRTRVRGVPGASAKRSSVTLTKRSIRDVSPSARAATSQHGARDATARNAVSLERFRRRREGKRLAPPWRVWRDSARVRPPGDAGFGAACLADVREGERGDDAGRSPRPDACAVPPVVFELENRRRGCGRAGGERRERRPQRPRPPRPPHRVPARRVDSKANDAAPGGRRSARRMRSTP